MVKYADDATIIDTVLKANETTTHKTGRERQITITDNTIQSAANEAVLWCENTSQRINASKQYMMLTLQINAAVSPSINIKGETVQQMKTAKLLGVTIDLHLTFSSHTKSVVDKTRSAVHGLLTLKRHGVSTASLIKFYQARITPILTYAAPSWYSYIPQYAADQLERHQSLCLRLIYPTVSSYTKRLKLSRIPRINDLLRSMCCKYVAKVANDPTHKLHHHIPEKQSSHRHSTRLANNHRPTSRTALLSISIFHKYL